MKKLKLKLIKKLSLKLIKEELKYGLKVLNNNKRNNKKNKKLNKFNRLIEKIK